MTRAELTKQRDDLRRVLAQMLRITADPDPLHPSWTSTRQKAAVVFKLTEGN